MTNAARLINKAVGRARALPARFKRRTRGLWVFGNVHGFKDNPRYLLEFLVDTRPDIQSTWISADPRVVAYVRQLGHRAELATTKAAIEAASRAEVAVIANGSSDLPAEAFAGAFILQLWHGVPLKRILLDYEPDYRLGPAKARAIGAPLGRILMTRAYRRYDLVPTTSPLAAQRLSTAFGLPSGRIPITGQPRDDVLLERRDNGRFQPPGGARSASKVMLWSPTYRDRDQGIRWREAPWHAIEMLLERMDAEMHILLHPFESPELVQELTRESKYIRVLRQADADINALMRTADVLVTDYSSVAFDFSLLDRPVLFFAPDLIAYTATRPLYEPYSDFTGGHFVESWEGLLQEAGAALSEEPGAFVAARSIARRFTRHHDGRARERIIRLIDAAVSGS